MPALSLLTDCYCRKCSHEDIHWRCQDFTMWARNTVIRRICHKRQSHMQIAIQLTWGCVKGRSPFPSWDFGVKHDAVLRMCAFPFIFGVWMKCSAFDNSNEIRSSAAVYFVAPVCHNNLQTKTTGAGMNKRDGVGAAV